MGNGAWEVAGTLLCIGENPSVSRKTISTEHETEKCILDHPHGWGIGAAADTHTHPVFDWPRDYGRMCAGEIMTTERDVLINNVKGMGHSAPDKTYAKWFDRPSYLSDSVRHLYVFRKDANGEWNEELVP